ncbi:MAG: hypothetical protein GY818_20870, partial [Planctomycetaceae bacterium]|nr:hypothetical protein [Planctomycetaceae bacterium]
YWLTSSSRKLKQFVQNKVNAINSIFEAADWGHTPSQENPADLVSRGCSAQSVRDSTLWEKGPTWLADQSTWPQWPKPQPSSTTVLAAAAEQQVNLESRGDISKIIDLDRFNQYSRLLATSVYVHRFCYRTGTQGPPTVSELEHVEKEWIRAQQQQHYPQVLDYLTAADDNKGNAPPLVRQLTLVLDKDGLIRSKGRFALNSSLILLPQHSRLTQLIILDCHQRLRHIGVGGTIVSLRQRFWVPSARSTTRRLLNKCVRCKKVTGRHYLLPASPELPKFRLDTTIRPFSNVGIDFTGHL